MKAGLLAVKKFKFIINTIFNTLSKIRSSKRTRALLWRLKTSSSRVFHIPTLFLASKLFHMPRSYQIINDVTFLIDYTMTQRRE